MIRLLTGLLFVVLNFDGSVINGQRAVGLVIHDSHSSLVHVVAYGLGPISVIFAKVVAIHNGIRLTSLLGYRHNIVEGDNQLIINAIIRTSLSYQVYQAI